MPVTPLPTPPLYAATPSLSINGEPEATLGERVQSLVVEEDNNGLRCCEIRCGNWGTAGGGLGLVLSDRATVDFGRELTVEMGAGDRAGMIFDGRITGIEERYPSDRPPELLLLAEDRLQDLRMTRRTRSFEDVSDEDVVNTIAGEHGLTADVSLSGPTHRVLVQLNQSDLAFLRDRARTVDARLSLEGTTLRVASRATGRGEPVSLSRGADLRAVTVLADLAHQRTLMVVGGWDVAAKAAIAAEATASSISSEVQNGTSGPDMLEEAIGARREQIVHRQPATSEEGQALADAAFRERARRFLTGTAEAEGDSRITVGGTVALAGLSPALSGEYDVTEVSHRFDQTGGYRTVFRFQRAWIGGAA